MPSRTSNKPPPTPSLWKAAPGCSEEGLAQIARSLAPALKPGDRVLLEGPMGAGKTTFARALLVGLGVKQAPEGSPTFPIAHQYLSARGFDVVHIDFYRLRSEAEIEDAGIPALIWEQSSPVVLMEWLSQWPVLEREVLGTGRSWRVEIAFGAGEELREVRVLGPLLQIDGS